jgi:PEP-CTERM motif
MTGKALFKAALGTVAAVACVAAQAAPSPIAPACVAVLTEPSWAECADETFQSALADITAASFVNAVDAPDSMTNVTTPNASADGRRRDRSQARVYPLQVVPSIPEPHTMVLMLAGVVAIGFMAMRRRDR